MLRRFEPMGDGQMAEDWSRPMVHWELQAKDAERMAAFYGAMFNWEIAPGRLRTISAGIGAPETITGHIRESSDAKGFVLYFQVLKLGESLKKAEELGGKVVREAFDTPGGQTLAWIDDPEGNRVILVQQ
jgi:predicted enzyme related to lactoylglutathione lyase